MSRSTARRPSIGIAGAGIIGMALAWRLAQAGHSVVVFEKSKVGGEASWAGAGMLAPGGEFVDDTPIARLATESRDLYPAFVGELEEAAQTRIDLQETGALDLAYSTSELSALEERVTKQRTLGIPAKRLDAQRIRTFWPRLRTHDLAGGFFYPGDAVVNPREVLSALRMATGALGVRIAESSPVTKAEVGRDLVRTTSGAGEFLLDALVIASGAWSSSIQLVGTDALPASEPVRGHLLGYRQPEQTCLTIVRHGENYMLQRANGLLIAGASVERVGFDRSIDGNAASGLQAKAEFVMPHLGETTPSEVWNGFRPGSDSLHVGQWHSPRLYLAYGHYRNGILLAPVTAKLLAEEISANLRRL